MTVMMRRMGMRKIRRSVRTKLKIRTARINLSAADGRSNPSTILAEVLR